MVRVSVGLVAVVVILGVLAVFGITTMLSPEKESTPETKTISNTTPTLNCRADTECTKLMNKTLKICTRAVCASGKCSAVPIANCCGNNITEEIENDLPGNKCTCPKDYGICNSTVRYTDATNKLITSKYFTRECMSDVCEVQYLENVQRDAEVFNVWTGTGFIINSYVKYSNPLYADSNDLTLDFRLVDYEKDKLDLPIVITEVRLMENTKILSRISPNAILLSVSQTQTMTMSVSNYDFIYPEEAKTLKLSIDYEYVPLRKVTSNSQTTYEKLPVERKTYTISLTDKIIFLDKSLVE